MTYTIAIKPDGQDNVNFIPFQKGDKMPHFLDYEEVLKFSLKKAYIHSEDEIKSLCDGSDHIEPYFSSMTAAEDCKATLEAEDNAPEFKENISYYELF